ncbi:hypothetical protein [Geomonas azotofigens]|uniref:hypothetical protein n=1 Tax=Geomonas azotofigens TaxID=2843196 RepID=UPI001C109AAD|nr:hypothetical protein [Geomonas azotofigens]MBU5614501.1 hypothetical protein [Geomonas azotofigens]
MGSTGRVASLACAAIMSVAVIGGCAAGLTGTQQAELQGYRNKGLSIEEKNPSTAAWFGILPGGGSFYTRNYGFGIANLLLWPFSVLWDPVSGYNGAEALNYSTTVSVVEKKRNAELHDLDTRFSLGAMTKEEYLTQKAACEKRYSPDL